MNSILFLLSNFFGHFWPSSILFSAVSPSSLYVSSPSSLIFSAVPPSLIFKPSLFPLFCNEINVSKKNSNSLLTWSLLKTSISAVTRWKYWDSYRIVKEMFYSLCCFMSSLFIYSLYILLNGQLFSPFVCYTCA